MKLEDKCKRYIIKRLLNVYCEIFGTRSYGGDALASSCVLRHMDSCRIFHNIHSITYKYLTRFQPRDTTFTRTHSETKTLPDIKGFFWHIEILESGQREVILTPYNVAI